MYDCAKDNLAFLVIRFRLSFVFQSGKLTARVARCRRRTNHSAAKHG